jgi:hypothetical protein
MSLKGFHIVFIILSVLLTAGFAGWAFSNETALPVGIGSAVLSVLLVIYGIWFVKKSRNIIT